jgi:hypothetical protein
MSTVGLQRASIFALKKEVVAGDYLPPSTGSEFVPLRPGNTLNFQAEALESDELLNDIGAAKAFTGKESVEGSHSAYLRHSGVEGQEPEVGVLYESVMGSKVIHGTEFVTVAGSTTTVLKVANGSLFSVGQALLIKDASNGYSIRNIKSISTNDLILNFALSAAPVSGVALGKAIQYSPVAQGHPTFSTTKYLGNGHAIEASSGNTVTEFSLTADANGFGEVEFSYQGTKYFYNPITIDASSKYIDVTDDSGTFAVSVPEKIYKTPIELADALQAAFSNASTESYTVSYSNASGKFTISSGSSVLELLWDSGTNTANSIGSKLGFDTSADDTGATSYTSDDAQSYQASLTPAYDSADAIIIKGAELFIGDQLDNACVCAQSVSLTVSKEVTDVDCICEETGVKEKIATARSVEMTVTAVLNKYDAALLDALLKNKSITAQLNAGPKAGGNWVPGKCFNAYVQNCTVSAYTTTGDSFIQAEITLQGFVTSSAKDLYLNFV